MPSADNEKYLKAIALRQKYPCMTGAAIARHLGVSRQRVHQMLGGHNSRLVVPRYCLNCNGILSATQHEFCSRKCRHDYTYPLLICEVCGKEFRRRQFYLTRQSFHRHGKTILLRHSVYTCSPKCGRDAMKGTTYVKANTIQTERKE